MAKKYSSQIYRCDGRNMFFEVLNSAFPIGKMQMSFCSYNEQTKKQEQKLDLYLDVLDALALSNDILTGNFARIVAEAARTGKFNGQDVSPYTSYFVDMGGMSEETVAKRFESISKQFAWAENGKAIARHLKIQKGTKYPWVIRAEYGLGQSTDKGLIAMQGQAKSFVNIPVSNEDFKKFAVAMKINYEAYLNQYYSKFGDTLFRDQKCEMFTPDAK